MSEPVTRKSPLNVEALRAAIRDVNKNKEAASEAQGRAGKKTKEVCEANNWNTKAFTFVSGLSKKEPAQQKEVLGGIVAYAAAMGMFDSSDMFDDHIGAMQQVIENATAGKPRKVAGAGLVATLASANAPH